VDDAGRCAHGAPLTRVTIPIYNGHFNPDRQEHTATRRTDPHAGYSDQRRTPPDSLNAWQPSQTDPTAPAIALSLKATTRCSSQGRCEHVSVESGESFLNGAEHVEPLAV